MNPTFTLRHTSRDARPGFIRVARGLRRSATCLGLVAATLLGRADAGAGAADAALLDDFSSAVRSSVGAARMLIDDASLGSQSTATQSCADGIVTVKGTLVPGRGVPAFISFVLLATPDAQPRDLSAYEGVRIRMKVSAGMISVQASSTEIDNFDYHSSPLPVQGAEFQEVRVAFRDMKRAWSGPTPLNPKTITSINLVAFGMAKGDFAYEVDEIAFY